MSKTDTIDNSASWQRGSWMQTFTGRAFHPLDPRVGDLDIRDIAHSLGMQCRYNGHVQKFYSVAEHCVLMSDWILENARGHYAYDARPLALWALLHDAPEAYIGDMVRPLKQHMPDFCEADDRIMRVIAERFGLSGRDQLLSDGTSGMQLPPFVKSVDTRILLDERAALLSTPPGEWTIGETEPLGVEIRAWDPAIAKWEYLARFQQLTGESI